MQKMSAKESTSDQCIWEWGGINQDIDLFFYKVYAKNNLEEDAASGICPGNTRGGWDSSPSFLIPSVRMTQVPRGGSEGRHSPSVAQFDGTQSHPNVT